MWVSPLVHDAIHILLILCIYYNVHVTEIHNVYLSYSQSETSCTCVVLDMYVPSSMSHMRSKHKMFSQYCFNVGPVSTTVGQHQNNIASATHVCRHTVDLVIFAYLNIREYVILGLFARSRIRELSILIIVSAIIIINVAKFLNSQNCPREIRKNSNLANITRSTAYGGCRDHHLIIYKPKKRNFDHMLG